MKNLKTCCLQKQPVFIVQCYGIFSYDDDKCNSRVHNEGRCHLDGKSMNALFCPIGLEL